MDLSRITDDSVLKKMENNIQQYISLIQDEKFFERMRQDCYKDRNLLQNLGHTESKPNSNPYSSKYGKSKSVSWRDTGGEEHKKHRPGEMSDDFGNESELDNKSRQTKRGYLPEVAHNDSKVKKREEFLYVTLTRSSQQSITKPARDEPRKKDKSQEKSIGEVKQLIPDDTRSEGHWNLPSISKQDISVEKSRERSRNQIRSKKEFKEDVKTQRPVSAIKPMEKRFSNNSNKQRAPEINLDKLGETDSPSEDVGTVGDTTKKQIVEDFYENIKIEAAQMSYTESSKKATFIPEKDKSESKLLSRLPTITTTKREAVDDFYDEIKRAAEDMSKSVTSRKSSVKPLKPPSRKYSVKKQPAPPREEPVRTYERIETKTTIRMEAADEFYESIKNRVLERTLTMMSSETDKKAVEDYYKELSNRAILRSNTLASNITSMSAAEEYYTKLADKAINATFTEKSYNSRSTRQQVADDYWSQLAKDAGNISIDTPKPSLSKLPTMKEDSFIESVRAITAKPIQPSRVEQLIDTGSSDRVYEKHIVNPLILISKKECFKFIKPVEAKQRYFVSPYFAVMNIERIYYKPKPAIPLMSPKPLQIVKLLEKTSYEKPKPKIQTMKNLVIDSELANKALETYTYKAPPKTLPPAQASREIEAMAEEYYKKKSQSAIKESSNSRMFITEIDEVGRSSRSIKNEMSARKLSPGSDINYSQREVPRQTVANKASIDNDIHKMSSNLRLARNSYDKSDRYKVPAVPAEAERGPTRNSKTDLNMKNSNGSLERGINIATNVGATGLGGEEEGPSVHNIYGNYQSGARDQFASNSQQEGYYTADDMNRIRDQIKASIQGMFDLKKGEEDSELTSLIARFYHLMMDEKNRLSRDKADIIIDLVGFYQEYILNLREEAKVAVHSADIKLAVSKDERERNLEMQREINNLRIELKDAHEDKLEAFKKMKAIDFVKRKNEERVREIEQKYEDNIEKFKDLLRNVNEEFLNARKHEIQITDRLNVLKREYDQLYHENMGLKTDITNLDFKDKERQFEVERVLADLRNQVVRNEALLRERDVFSQRIMQYQERMAELESAQIEIENYRAKSTELNRNVESLRAEIRNKDLAVMDLQHRVNHNERVQDILREENSRMITRKEAEGKLFNAKMNDMKDNMFSHEYHKNKLQQSGRTIKKENNETSKYIRTFGDDRQAGPVRQIRNPIIHSLNSRATDGVYYSGPGAYSPTVRGNSAVRNQHKQPASDSEIKKAIQEYNAQLYHYQDKKVILDSMLCRLPTNPRSAKEMQLKESLDLDYTNVQNKIAEYKKLLRDMRAL